MGGRHNPLKGEKNKERKKEIKRIHTVRKSRWKWIKKWKEVKEEKNKNVWFLCILLFSVLFNHE